jgi:hypothetical protein
MTQRGVIAMANDDRSVVTKGPAMRIDVTADEVRALRDILEAQIADLGPEIHHTRTPDYHDSLKALREKLKTLDRELSEATP